MAPELRLPAAGPQRRRAALLLATVAVVIVLVVLLVARLAGGAGASDTPPARDALRVVPAGTLVAVDVSTDRSRDAVKRADALARRFPSFARLRTTVLRGLAVGGSTQQIGAWLGGEATLALLDSQSGTAGSLLVLAVGDDAKAHAFVARGAQGRGPSETYHGILLRPYGTSTAAFAGRRLLIGQPETVRAAIDVAQGRARSLASDPTFRRVTSGLPADRAAEAYATAGGVRRALAPATGVLGLLGTLLDRPALRATALSVSADAPGALVTIRSLASGGSASSFAEFRPALVGALPAGVLAYLGVKGIDRAAGRLLAAASGTGAASGIAQLVAVAQKQLAGARNARVRNDLLAPLRGETAVVLTSHAPAPILSIVARTSDEARTRAAIARVAPVLRDALRDAHLSTTKVAGATVTTLRAGTAIELDAAVFDGRLVLSTSPDGIAAFRAGKGALAGSEAFKSVTGTPGRAVSSLLFLDFNQLLTLGEQTGLGDSAAYRAVKGDLTRVRSVGFVSSGRGGDTTAQLRLEIP